MGATGDALLMNAPAILFAALCTVTRLPLKDDTLPLGTKDSASLAKKETLKFHLGLEDLGASTNFMMRL